MSRSAAAPRGSSRLWTVVRLFLALALWGSAAPAVFAQDAAAMVLFIGHGHMPASDGDSAGFADSALAAVERAFASEGLRVVSRAADQAETGDLEPEGERAVRLGAADGSRWATAVALAAYDRRLLWRFSVYDTQDGSLVAADAYSAFAGLTALTLIESSARDLAAAWKGALDAARMEVGDVAGIQRFTAAEDGVSVRYGSLTGDGKEAGTVRDGVLDAPYIPFGTGEPIYLEVHRDGYWTKRVDLPKGFPDRALGLPRLQKKATYAWGAGTGVGRLMGASAFFRWYPLEDRLFLRAENALWLNYEFLPGSAAVLHDEVRFGTGTYLQSRRDAAFRYAAGFGLSAIFTKLTDAPGMERTVGLDWVAEPLWLTLEYHRPRWALVLEQRVPFALGTGFLERGWMELSGAGPLFFSLGVLFKW